MRVEERRAGTSGRRLVALLVGAVLATGGAAGCAPTSADLAPQAARELQVAVDELVRAVAQGRYDAAGHAAREVRETLEDVADAGQLTASRYRQIDDALTRTEHELAAAIAAQEQGPAGPEESGEAIAADSTQTVSAVQGAGRVGSGGDTTSDGGAASSGDASGAGGSAGAGKRADAKTGQGRADSATGPPAHANVGGRADEATGRRG